MNENITDRVSPCILSQGATEEILGEDLWFLIAIKKNWRMC